MVRSSRLLQSVWKQQDELQVKRAAAERKMQQLIEVQKQVSMLESNNEVWGPADPDHVLVKKYRRLWMERPLNFPMRREHSSQTAGVQTSWQLPSSPKNSPRGTDRAVRILSGQEQLFSQPVDTFQVPDSPLSSSRPSATGNKQPPSTELARIAAELATVKPRDQGLCGRTCPPELSCTQRYNVSPGLESPPSAWSEIQTPSSWPTPEPPAVPSVATARDNVSSGDAFAAPVPPPAAPPPAAPSPRFGGEPLLSPSPCFGTGFSAGVNDSNPGVSSDIEDLARRITLERKDVKKALPKATGSEWTEDQWVLKALQMAEGFAAEEEGWAPGISLSSGSILDPPKAEAENAPAPPSPRTPPPQSRGVLCSRGVEVPLLATVEDSGLDAIPDWYDALDRVYEIQDMVQFSTPPVPVLADKTIINSPGHSYAVSKRPAGASVRRVGAWTTTKGVHAAAATAPAAQQRSNSAMRAGGCGATAPPGFGQAFAPGRRAPVH